MGKTVRLAPIFRCKSCGSLYHPYQFGILEVDDEKLTEQNQVQAIMKASEIHECDIDKIGIAVCVGFNKVECQEEENYMAIKGEDDEHLIDGVFRLKAEGGGILFRQKNDEEVYRIDFDEQYEPLRKFSFDTSRYGGSQAFMKSMLERGYQYCKVLNGKIVPFRK